MLEMISSVPIVGALLAAVAVYVIFKILGFFGTLFKIGLSVAIFIAIMHWFG